MIGKCCICREIIASLDDLGASAGSFCMGTLDVSRLVCRSEICLQESLKRQKEEMIASGVPHESATDNDP